MARCVVLKEASLENNEPYKTYALLSPLNNINGAPFVGTNNSRFISNFNTIQSCLSKKLRL